MYFPSYGRLGPAELGLIFAGIGVVMVIVQGGLVGPATDRWGERRVAVAGASLLALGLATLPFVPVWLGYLALGAVAVGQGLLSTTTAVLTARASGQGLGGAFGVGQSASAAARVVGPLVAGAAFDFRAALPYIVGAGFCVAAAAFLNATRHGRGGARDVDNAHKYGRRTGSSAPGSDTFLSPTQPSRVGVSDLGRQGPSRVVAQGHGYQASPLGSVATFARCCVEGPTTRRSLLTRRGW